MQLSVLATIVAVLASSADAFGKKPPPKVKPHLVKGFAWKDPFPAAKEAFEPACEVAEYFYALEFTLHELKEEPPRGLKPWSKALKKFFSKKEYPGGWSGYDRHGPDRSLLQMDYNEVPLELRKWVEQQVRTDGEFKDMFAVFMKPDESEGNVIEDIVEVGDEVDRSQDENKVMIFAPGALYHVLPLWVAETSDCKERLLNLENYSPEPAGGQVIGWVDHKKPKEHITEFRITVQELQDKVTPSSGAEGASEADGSKAEL